MAFQIWNPDWFPLPGQAVFDHEKQQVAAVSRASGNLDLFVIGFDNHVWTTFWNDSVGWNADWFPVPGGAVFDHDKQQLAAVSRAPGNLDLFVIGFDNHVWTTFWNDSVGWNSDWFPLPGAAVFDRERQQLAAVSRTPDNLVLFVIGFDNHVWTTFWGPRNPMTLEVTFTQNSNTVPIMVFLQIDASDGIVTETKYDFTKNGVLVPEIGNRAPAGVELHTNISIGDPGNYVLTASRTGLVGPGVMTTLTKQFNITAQSPEVVPPPTPPPHIDVTFSGTITNAEFHVTGTGFLANRLINNHGVAIRVVDANALIETRREFTGSSAAGTIDHMVEGDLSGLVLNALGVATIAFSATDGRADPNDATGFLWSNTVRKDFS